jgi:polysaccharide export outer membrane protein
MRFTARIFATALTAATVFLLSACEDTQPSREPAPHAAQTHSEQAYRLGSGDKLRIIVFGEDDLGGQYDVDGTGFVRLPLIGPMQAAGLTAHEFENAVKAKLEQGFLKNARVNVEVTNYRPFYILGEVNKPGEYPYVNDMSVLNAVALAGGYTYRADDSEVYIRRNGRSEEESLPADQTTLVNPGDIVRVAERFF